MTCQSFGKASGKAQGRVLDLRRSALALPAGVAERRCDDSPGLPSHLGRHRAAQRVISEVPRRTKPRSRTRDEKSEGSYLLKRPNRFERLSRM